MKIASKFSNNSEIKFIIRPYAEEMLKILSIRYVIVIYTSSSLDYAKHIVKLFDKNRDYISKILSRENCLVVNTKLIKDLRLISDRKIENSIIIDNNICCFYSCMNNGIYVKTFEGDCQDRELKKIVKFLDKIKNCKDVREEIKKKFGLEESYKKYLKSNKKPVSFSSSFFK